MGDNGVFAEPGSIRFSATSTRHFTPDLPAIFEKLRDQFPDEYNQYYRAYYDDATNEEILQMIYYYSPYHYITEGETDLARHFRINVGTQDSDTSPTVSAVLALLLKSKGVDTDYNLMWNLPHIDADFEGEFEDWVNSICKSE